MPFNEFYDPASDSPEPGDSGNSGGFEPSQDLLLQIRGTRLADTVDMILRRPSDGPLETEDQIGAERPAPRQEAWVVAGDGSCYHAFRDDSNISLHRSQRQRGDAVVPYRMIGFAASPLDGTVDRVTTVDSQPQPTVDDLSMAIAHLETAVLVDKETCTVAALMADGQSVTRQARREALRTISQARATQEITVRAGANGRPRRGAKAIGLLLTAALCFGSGMGLAALEDAGKDAGTAAKLPANESVFSPTNIGPEDVTAAESNRLTQSAISEAAATILQRVAAHPDVATLRTPPSTQYSTYADIESHSGSNGGIVGFAGVRPDNHTLEVGLFNDSAQQDYNYASFIITLPADSYVVQAAHRRPLTLSEICNALAGVTASDQMLADFKKGAVAATLTANGFTTPEYNAHGENRNLKPAQIRQALLAATQQLSKRIS